MKLKSVEIDNYRAIEQLRLSLDPTLTVLHGSNTCGKTSVLSAIAVGLGVIPRCLPGVSGIRLGKIDRRTGSPGVKVSLTTTDGVAWECEWFLGRRRQDDIGSLQEMMANIVHADGTGEPMALPIVVFYDTDRSIVDRVKRHRSYAGERENLRPQESSQEDDPYTERDRYSLRYSALDGALAARANFWQLFRWFRAKEDLELREQKRHRDFDFRQRDLSAVRDAISSMLDGVSEPRIDVQPLRFSVAVQLVDGRTDRLELDQLSDGQRAVLALAADLAWRMAQGNPHLDEPLHSEAVVLIDEVELHLHPSWQQRILIDLRRTFPNTQFIVSTHSPQVLTTVEPEHIVELAREDGRIVAGSAAGWTYGAEAGDVLSVVMGVDERPANDFTEKLARYRRLINDDQGESEEALALRQELQRRSPDDPALGRADLEIRRRKLFREVGDST